jgi:hypothetical protein
MMRSPKHRRPATPMDRVLGLALAALVVYLAYLGMTGRATGLVRDLAAWVKQAFG